MNIARNAVSDMERYIKFEDVLEALNEIRCSDCSCEKPLDCALCQIGVIHKQILTKHIYLNIAPKSEVAKEIIGEILLNHTPNVDGFFTMHESELDELKRKYTEGSGNDNI